MATSDPPECEQLQGFGLKTLLDVFDRGSRMFRVPDYQRGYSWEESHRSDLLQDIENIANRSFNHYTGTIVAVESPDRAAAVYDIVDGQQRLTSLVLLLAALYQATEGDSSLSDAKRKELRHVFLYREESVGNSLPALSLNGDLDRFFQSYVGQGTSTHPMDSKSHQNIADAFHQFSAWIKGTELSTGQIYETVCSKFGCLLYFPGATQEVGMMFEVINNRGKPLSELEKVKNYLVYFAGKHGLGDLGSSVKATWGLILGELSAAGCTTNDDENEFLRFCWIVFQDVNKSRSHRVYDNLKAAHTGADPNLESDYEALSRFVKFLHAAARAYRFFYKGGDETDLPDDQHTWLNRLLHHPSRASVMPLIIALYARLDPFADAADLTRLLEIIEKLNFRYYGMKIAGRADTGQGDLFWYAHTFYNQFGEKIPEDNSNSVLCDVEWLEAKLCDFVSRNAPDQDVVKNLTLDKDESGDYYNWAGLRFFLASYEEKLAENEGGKSKSGLDAMLAPQDPDSPNAFFHREHLVAKKDYTVFDDADAPDVNKRRLGNFLLLKPSTNIRVSNSSLPEKVELYKKWILAEPHTRMLREIGGYYESAVTEGEEAKDENGKKRWQNKCAARRRFVTQRTLDAREEKLVNFALERWHMDPKTKPCMVPINSTSEGNEIYGALTPGDSVSGDGDA